MNNIEGPSYDASYQCIFIFEYRCTPLASKVTQATNKLSATEILAAYILERVFDASLY